MNELLKIYGINRSTYYGWLKGKGIEKRAANQRVKSIVQITEEEENKVLEYRKRHPEVGYRKLAWMMVDENVVYLTESTVYKVLSKHNMLNGWNKAVDDKDTQKEYRNKPKRIHHHWHVDIAYIKVRNIFYFLIMLLDGYSRFLLDWELMTDMTGRSVEMFIQSAKERYPHEKPMLINDNGSQFISIDFKRLVSRLEIQQVFTRRNHPQTNGKIERMNGTVKSEAIRPGCPVSYQEAWNILNDYSYRYNYQRLHAGINYLRPADMFFGRDQLILQERKQKLINGRERRKQINLVKKYAA